MIKRRGYIIKEAGNIKPTSIKMVIREGLEPSTQWLKAICSTD